MKKIDPHKYRLFLKHLAITSKKHQEAEKEKDKLAKQMVKLKKAAEKKTNKEEILKEIEKLEENIANALVKTRKVKTHRYEEDRFFGDLLGRIEKLDGVLSDYLRVKEERKTRVKQIEENIKLRAKKEEEKGKLKDKIESLEAVYNTFKMSGRYKGKKLEEIKKKIDELHKKLK